ncbi:MAG TPA: hypothetical protein VFF67_02235 [Thermoplasmata archaeon]|nr:hypothetical protein [Thermoplasmata archaeon]
MDSPTEGAPRPDAPTELPPGWRLNRGHLFLGLLLVVLGTVALEWAFTGAPVPPGSDPGDWISRSYAYVGLPPPPIQAVGSPFLYPPFLFPFVGAVYLGTGSATLTGAFIAGALLFVYGLSVFHLGARFLRTGPVLVGFVGLAVFNGTTLSMLFWGAYPNFLAFILFNEALVFFLTYAERGRAVDGVLTFVLLALSYLSHSLTFVLLVGVVAFGFLLLWAARRTPLRRLWSYPTLGGAALLGAVVLGYSQVTAALGIPHPNYLSANPAAFTIDNIGEIFVPLANAPSIAPAGAPLVLTPLGAVAVLVGAALLTLLLVAAATSRRPRAVSSASLVTAGWLVVALLLPVAGYFAHVDTDYPRFLYYVPLPALLLLALLVEHFAIARWRAPTADPVPPAPRAGAAGRNPRRLTSGTVATVAVLTVIVVVAANLAAPTLARSEQLNTGTSHDGLFLDAVAWLKRNPTAGAVLTLDRTIRWTEALTDRGAYDVGPTWLLFEPWQITNAEETYWALNSLDAVTNNNGVLSFSGFGSPVMSQAPMYSVMLDGVTVSLLRILPGASYLNESSGNATTQANLTDYSTPILTVPGSAPLSSEVDYSGPTFAVREVATLAPTSATSWINFTVTPAPRAGIQQFVTTLADPPHPNANLHTGSPPSVSVLGNRVAWNITSVVGRFPGTPSIDSTLLLSPAPSAWSAASSVAGTHLVLTFTNPAPTRPFEVSIELATPGASNPAVVLPTYLATRAFLAQTGIHFLFVPNDAGDAATMAFYEANFGYTVGYANAEWAVLQG